jgi:hypothetical protein
MTRKSSFTLVLANIERGRYPYFVPIQHHTEHAGITVGKELIDQL